MQQFLLLFIESFFVILSYHHQFVVFRRWTNSILFNIEISQNALRIQAETNLVKLDMMNIELLLFHYVILKTIYKYINLKNDFILIIVV